jgi:hypothetical protein
MSEQFRQSDLEAYLDEALPAEEMAAIERALRGNQTLVGRLSSINSRRNAGVHSVGEIWRAHRLSCPSKDELGSFLLQALSDAAADYVSFHLEAIGCRYCLATMADLKAQQKEDDETVNSRRRRYFQSSAGYLRARK